MTMNSLKFTWAFASLLIIIVILLPIATCHMPQCSFEGINLEKCMDSPSSFDSCCNALNQVIQRGYYCLCAILGSSSPLITTSLVLPLSKCFISIPPLTQCQAPQEAKVSPVQDQMKPPPSRPRPIFWPPKLPKEPPPSPLLSVPKDVVLPLPPNMDDIPVLNSTRYDNNITIQSPKLKFHHKDGILKSFGGDEDKFLLYARVLLLITITFYVMLI